MPTIKKELIEVSSILVCVCDSLSAASIFSHFLLHYQPSSHSICFHIVFDATIPFFRPIYSFLQQWSFFVCVCVCACVRCLSVRMRVFLLCFLLSFRYIRLSAGICCEFVHLLRSRFCFPDKHANKKKIYLIVFRAEQA